METGATVKWGQDFASFNEPLEPYGKSPKDLLEAGRLVQLPPHPKPETFNYSYHGACQATLSEGYGELDYAKGHPSAGVVFQRLGGRPIPGLRGKVRRPDHARLRQRWG